MNFPSLLPWPFSFGSPQLSSTSSASSRAADLPNPGPGEYKASSTQHTGSQKPPCPILRAWPNTTPHSQGSCMALPHSVAGSSGWPKTLSASRFPWVCSAISATASPWGDATLLSSWPALSWASLAQLQTLGSEVSAMLCKLLSAIHLSYGLRSLLLGLSRLSIASSYFTSTLTDFILLTVSPHGRKLADPHCLP